MQPVRLQGRGMTYKGINFCDRCGGSLEDGRWLSGICRRCEEESHDSSLKVTKASGRKRKEETVNDGGVAWIASSP